MSVIKRSGRVEAVDFNEITKRNQELCSNKYGKQLVVDCEVITEEVRQRFKNNITTRELDAETAGLCAARIAQNLDYDWLTSRIHINDLHKRTSPSLLETIKHLKKNSACRLSEEYIMIVERIENNVLSKLVLYQCIDFNRDYKFKWFGYQTLSRSYLMKDNPSILKSTLLSNYYLERPQHLYMRIALGIFMCNDSTASDALFHARLLQALKYYKALSRHQISNATPTILNVGTNIPQLSSCFQISVGDDIESLYQGLLESAKISKYAGGISIWLHNIRAAGTLIKSTGGLSTGFKHYIKILNESQIYVNQGGNRPGATAIYLSVDHADIMTFISIGRIKGEESSTKWASPDLKYALWIPDLFIKKLIEQIKTPGSGGDWHLFNPVDAPGLYLKYGEEYEKLYNQYVAEGRYSKIIKAGDIIFEAFKNWQQVGNPYVMFKDAINHKSNLKHVAPICSSNLCCEITIPSWSNFDVPTFAQFNKDNNWGETGVCIIGAICLESFVIDGVINYKKIAKAAKMQTIALNKVIDLNYYPTPECRNSSQRHRPIGIGIMGLANVFASMKILYNSQRACEIARSIAATIYYAAIKQSHKLALIDGPFQSFKGSPISQGKLQPDLWCEFPSQTDINLTNWEEKVEKTTGGYLTKSKWNKLRLVVKDGIRNAYLTAYMPTATTSNIIGQNESFEPFTSNIYVRKTLAGDFMIVNPYLIDDLTKLGLWSSQIYEDIILAGGSIQHISNIPESIKEQYLTARELPQSSIIDIAASMAPFICQSMSMNLFLQEPNLKTIISFIIAGWKAGLKTGMYYCHTKAAASSQKTSANALKFTSKSEKNDPKIVDADKQIAFDADKQIGFDAAKQIGFDAAKQIGFDAAKQIAFDADKQIGFDAAKQIRFDTTKPVDVVDLANIDDQILCTSSIACTACSL